MISQSTISRVFEEARVEEVIGDFVQLKKSGSNFKGLSPFSDERSPSFMVSPVKQIWKDFSTGKGGNSVSFLMEHEHYTYPEAIKYLAKKYGIEIEELVQTDEQKELLDKRESMFLVSEYAMEYFKNILHNTGQGKSIGYGYFKERGFTNETIEKFNLGYAQDDWEAFSKEAISKGYALEFLESTGLTIVKENRTIDRFKGRVIFPIQSMSGRTLGFGGRILVQNKKAAKYLNSPESDIYHKSKVLYGLYHAKKAIVKEDCCYLVEGYTDVLQLHQKGVENVVASSGTALTPEQIRLISRLSKNIVVLFDGDAAGIRAAIRGVDLILEQGLNVKVCSFPDGDDPDTYAKKVSLDELKEFLLVQSKDFIQYKVSLLIEESKGDPIKKAEVVRDIISSISKIPDAIKRELYVKECASLLNVSEQTLFDTLAQFVSGSVDAGNKLNVSKKSKLEVVRTPEEPKVDAIYELERKIIEVLLLYGNQDIDFEDLILKEDENTGDLILKPVNNNLKVYEKIFLDLQEDEMEFNNPIFKSLFSMILNVYKEDNNLTVNDFVNSVGADYASEIVSILMDDEKYTLHNWEKHLIEPKPKDQSISQLVSQTILTLRCNLIDRKVKEFQNKTLEPNVDSRAIIEDVKDYLSLRTLLSQKLGKVVGGF